MSVLPPFNRMVASARIIEPRRRNVPTYEQWQEDLWRYYDAIPEFESAVSWQANSLSRVRLLAAELSPGGEEPTPVDTGPAADAILRLAGGTGGQAELMREMTVQLSVPGIGWLIGEEHGTSGEQWSVKSADELKVVGQQFVVQEDEQSFRRLDPETAFVLRFWRRNARYSWRPDSKARHALTAMTQLDLITKRIVAIIMSRLASNGILLYDKSRLSIPAVQVPEDPENPPPDPFAQQLVDIAGRGIQDHTSAEALIPLPVGFDLRDDDRDPRMLMQHIRFDSEVGERLLETYDRAVKTLSTTLDIPAEILLGLGDINHWTAWKVTEEGITVHIAPMAEVICNALTEGYLIPALNLMGADLTGPNGGKLVCWYDPSEITVRPDRSQNAIRLYDRLELSPDATRRETGFSDDDAPDDQELEGMIERLMARSPNTAAGVLARMRGLDAPLVDSGLEEDDPDMPGGGDERRGPPDRPDRPAEEDVEDEEGEPQ